jgi:PAS domain S-box-containing protein
MAFLAGIFSYSPQLTTLIQFPIQTDWQIAYFLAAYRLLFPLSVLVAAWRFGVKGGLVVCLVIGPVILSSVLVNSRLPNAWIDFGVIALGILLSWLIGKQGEMKQRLEETAAELRQQSTMLRVEITERKQAEEQYRLIAEHSADIIYKLAIKEEKFTYVSLSAERLLGYTEQEALATKLTDVLTPESYEKQHNQLQKDLQNGTSSSTLQLELIHKDGHIIPFEVHSSLVYNEKGEPEEIVGVARDITERKKMEEQLIVQDRLASIGQLTSGLAHELNNPLTSVISFSSLLLDRELPEDMRQDLKIINDEAQRIADIVKNLLTFARKQPQEKQPTNINGCIRKVLEMRTYEQKVNNIQVSVHLDPDLPQIIGNSSQLQQVFFNIVINAEFFMLEAHREGTLSITTEKAGNSVRALFADDGPGISRENMRRLFTPFFTTKEVGKGTGLSLSICLGIITEHGGRIYASSEPGKGAIFVIELPVNRK